MSTYWQEQAIIDHSPDFSRCTFRHGPIDIVARLDGPLHDKRLAYEAAKVRFQSILEELCQELSLLRTPIAKLPIPPTGEIAQLMFRAASHFGKNPHLTAMAAVAGAVAQTLLQKMIKAAELLRCSVNNGGDIALHLAPGQTYTAGICFDPDHPHVSDTATIRANDNIGGIATSGWRGRSHSLGIADSVTVFAASACAADIAATIIANAVNLPNSSKIMRAPANHLAPDSDLGDLPVTTHVAHLTEAECKTALKAAAPQINRLVAQDKIRAVHATLKGHRLTVVANDLNRARLLANIPPQTLNHTGAVPHA